MRPLASSNAAPGRFKFYWFESNAGPLSARPRALRLSVCPPWHQNQVAVVNYSMSGIKHTALPRFLIPIDLFSQDPPFLLGTCWSGFSAA